MAESLRLHEAAIGRFKQVTGDGLRSRMHPRRVAEVYQQPLSQPACPRTRRRRCCPPVAPAAQGAAKCHGCARLVAHRGVPPVEHALQAARGLGRDATDARLSGTAVRLPEPPRLPAHQRRSATNRSGSLIIPITLDAVPPLIVTSRHSRAPRRPEFFSSCVIQASHLNRHCNLLSQVLRCPIKFTQ